jgi:RNA polymerase-binding protein DksA
MQNQEHFKQKLTDMKLEHLQRIKAIDHDIRHEDMSADWSEQATERENDEVLESLGNSSEQELSMINLALKRLDSGSYFHCIDCADEITLARLELLPFTALCIACAEKSER